MALEPTDNVPTTDGGSSAISAMEAAFLAPAAKAAEPTPPVAPEPEPTPPAAPEPEPTPTDPIKEIENAADPKASKLPIDEDTPITDEDIPTDQKVKRKILGLKEEINTQWKPKVSELEQQIAERESRLAELKAQAEEAERLKEQLKTYEMEMSVVKLEKTPAYIKEVTEPFQKIQEKTDSIIDTYSLDRDKIYAAFAEPDEGKRRAALKEATAGLELDVDDQVELRALARDVQPLYAKRDELYANVDRALAELQARSEQETAAQAAARAEERAKAAETVKGILTKSSPLIGEFLKPEVIERVKDTDLDALDAQNKAFNHIAGLILNDVKKELLKTRDERDKLLDEIAAYEKASPRVGDGLAKGAPGDAAPTSMIQQAFKELTKGLVPAQ